MSPGNTPSYQAYHTGLRALTSDFATMTQRLKEAIDALNTLEGLPLEDQESLAAEIFELVESATSQRLQTLSGVGNKPLPIWERIAERSGDVPDEVWETLPADGAAEVDHYLYGTPKRNT